MVDGILELALANGLWAAMFVFLFVYQLKDGKKREEKYIKIINDLSHNLRVLESIESVVLDIQGDIKNKQIQEKVAIKKPTVSKKNLIISEDNIL